MCIDLIHSEVEWSNQNHTEECDIRHLNKHFWGNMVSNKVPNHLLYYGLVHQSGILSRIDCGKTGWMEIEEVTGQMPDISE